MGSVSIREYTEQELLIAKVVHDLFFVTPYYSEQQRTGSNRGDYNVAREGRSRKDKDISIESIADSIFEQSLTIGVYSTSRENTCKWICLDFDVDSPEKSDIIRARAEIFEVYRRCYEHNLFAYIESSGNKGYHIWIFFDELDSETAFKVGKILAGREVKESFPKQPHLSPTVRYGNLVRLPCNLNIKSGKPSRWLKNSFVVQASQHNYFLKLKKTPHDLLRKVAELYSEELPLDKKIEIVHNPSLKIDIHSKLFEIDKKKGNPPHSIQPRLILKCLEAGLTDAEILDVGAAWLKLYENRYNNSVEYRFDDFKKSLRYYRATAQMQQTV